MNELQVLIALAILSPGITVLEGIFAVRVIRKKKLPKGVLIVDALGYLALYFGLKGALSDLPMVDADWYVQISSNEAHTFLATEHRLTVFVLIVFGAACLIFLTLVSVKKLPPLVKVLTLSGVYAGTFLQLMIILQLFRLPLVKDAHPATNSYGPEVLFFEFPWIFLSALTIFLIAARTSFHVVRASGEFPESSLPREESTAASPEKLPRLRSFLAKSSCWPLLALILSFPLIGIISMILMLFGQSPAAVIKAFTETADWSFSTKIPPQSLFYDEHYLCTVAAGGHKKIVKPLRMGIRHGHPVVVNRQLQVANAFEQLLEEHTPRFHKAVRSFYDRFGFPFARLIHTKTGADIIYFVMKPLEWIFLIFLYLTDVHPEDRIAMQYTGKKKEDLL